MKRTCNNAKILDFRKEILEAQQRQSLRDMRDEMWMREFIKNNEEVLNQVHQKRTEILNEFFELDERGNPKQIQKFRDVTKKGKYFWNKDSIEQVPDGTEPILKEGKTLAEFNKVISEFLNAENFVTTKPKSFSRFPVVIHY